MIGNNTRIPFYGANVGLRTEFGAWVPPGARVMYVGSSRIEDGNDQKGVMLPTVAAALTQCRAGMGDTIFVLAGHSETITSATYLSALVAGTRIIGLGRGSNMPTLRLAAVAAQLAIAVADVEIAGLRLRLEGAAMTKAINITGADFCLRDCDIEVGSATAASVIAIEIGTAAHRCQILGNNIRGTVAAAVTDCILIAGVANGIRIEGNEIVCSTGAVGTGVIRGAAVAALDVMILGNILRNSLALSETCIGWGDAAATGIIARNFCASFAGTPVSDLIECHANSLFRMFENYGSDTKGTSGLLTPAIVT